MNLKQPALGIVATAVFIAVSLAFIALFDFHTFTGWVAYSLLCVIPMQIVTAITWGCRHPRALAGARPPVNGVLLTLLALAVGAVVAIVHFFTVGGGVSPPTPMLAMWAIASVPVMFWAAVIWGGWPFTTLIKNPVAAGFTMLVASYAVNYVLFRICFNYGFMQGAPVYVPALDPHGLFNAWNALVFYVTALAGMFLVINFDLWPLTRFPATMQQPVLGIVWTIVALLLGGIAFHIGVNLAGMDPVAFLVRVPVPFIFGTIVVLNMLHRSLFSTFAQPTKGVLNVVAAMIIGTLLSQLYASLAPVVTGELRAGPPAHEFEIWLGSALLSVTFPFLIFYAEFFKFWPLRKAELTAEIAEIAERQG